MVPGKRDLEIHKDVLVKRIAAIKSNLAFLRKGNADDRKMLQTGLTPQGIPIDPDYRRKLAGNVRKRDAEIPKEEGRLEQARRELQATKNRLAAM